MASLGVALAPPVVAAGPLQPAACPAAGSTMLGVSRIVEIDTSAGPLFGAISTQAKETSFLAPKEVVLTFDDGPMPAVTRSVLDTLDRFCTKATFFSIGRMAIAYPETVRNILDRGHTLGSHTWSHPLSLKRLALDKANEEIEKGHAAVSLAAGRPIAPFFRFPGLSDSAPMLKHLQTRGMGAFTVDAVSNDSYISDPERLLQHTLKEVEARKGGIVLFHDIKPATAKMLPRLLSELKARGYSVVHMRPKTTVAPLPVYEATLAPMLAKAEKVAKAQPLVPFYGLVKPGSLAEAPEVTAVAPGPRERNAGSKAAQRARTAIAKASVSRTAVRGWSQRSDEQGGEPGAGWSVKVDPAR